MIKFHPRLVTLVTSYRRITPDPKVRPAREIRGIIARGWGVSVAARYWDVEARKSYYRITAKTRRPWIKKVLLSLLPPLEGGGGGGRVRTRVTVEKEGRKKESGQRVLSCAIFCEWDRGSPSRSPSTSKEVLILETNLLLNLEMKWWWLEIGSFIKFVSLSSLTKPFYLWISGEMILVCCKKLKEIYVFI